jgi:hypothetical protein
MLAAQVNANKSSTHLKSELIMKLTAAIHPIETKPATMEPATAPRASLAKCRHGQSQREHAGCRHIAAHYINT